MSLESQIDMKTSIDTDYMKQAHAIAQQSMDPSTKVGALLVSPDGTSRFSGYNRFPAKIPNRSSWWNSRDSSGDDFSKYDLVCCAETDAISKASAPLTGWSLYITHYPCLNCAKLIALVGISRVVYNLSTANITKDIATAKVAHLLELADVSFEQLTF